jgi:preprotein translocase SecF subunit
MAAVLSLAVIAGTWFVFFQKGKDNFGVDFTGGASVTFEFNEKIEVDQIRDSLEKAGVKGSLIQYHREMSPDETGRIKEFLEVKAGYEDGETAAETLKAGGNFRVRQQDIVGPQVGEELRKRGVWAIVAALIGIVIYISFRFEFAFAMGAIVALVHDVLITIGIYCLLGRQLSLPGVAALLTIVGYSVNDTIVVFDRVREDLKLIRNKSYKDIANLSINQTLSRTLLTSITTLLTVVMLLIFGGGAINDFAVTLFIGIIVGTYSSIFVATPVMLFWHREEKPAEA